MNKNYQQNFRRSVIRGWLTAVLFGLVISQISCSKQPEPHIPQEGELVTWYMTPELVIRTRLGERREHIVGKHDAEFYRPHLESYLGQFPIDYQPERLEKISVAESNKWSADPMSIKGTLEFNLMLNGSEFKATDANINGPDGLDHVDQVKVEIQRRGIGDTWTSTADEYKRLKSSNGTYEEAFSSQYGLKCYMFFSKESDPLGRECYGYSTNPQASGVSIRFMSDLWVFAETLEPTMYGGLIVRWRIDRRNLAQWQDIDAAIWRLLEAWNIAPETTNLQIQQTAAGIQQ